MADKLFAYRMDDAQQHILWGMAGEDVLQCIGCQGELPTAGDSFSQAQERDDQAVENGIGYLHWNWKEKI